jgi:dienelactone hydrolase
MARSGASVAGVVSFHGGLDSPAPEDAKQVKAKVLFKLVTTTRAGLRITKKRIVACGKR